MSASRLNTILHTPPHSRAALRTIVSKTGWTSVGELPITRRTSAVAFCCSTASVSACLRLSTSLFGSAPDCAVGFSAFKGQAHSSQNVACGRLSCWHRGQCILSVSRFRVRSDRPGSVSRRYPAIQHQQRTLDQAPKFGVSGGMPRGRPSPTQRRSALARARPLPACQGTATCWAAWYARARQKRTCGF
jgi:hypothetical protein